MVSVEYRNLTHNNNSTELLKITNSNSYSYSNSNFDYIYLIIIFFAWKSRHVWSQWPVNKFSYHTNQWAFYKMYSILVDNCYLFKLLNSNLRNLCINNSNIYTIHMCSYKLIIRLLYEYLSVPDVGYHIGYVIPVK